MGGSVAREEFRGSARFQVLQLLGSGACGAVYEVFDRELDSVVALKTLERTEPALLYLFKQEFRELADVHDPHLVTLYELLNEDDRWFITMERVRGIDFFRYVRGEDAAPRNPITQTIPSSPLAPASAFTLADTPRAIGEGRALAGDDATSPARQAAPGAALDAAGLTRLRHAALGLAQGIVALHGARKLHRDLKPSNVLVEPGGRVVLLDFGLVFPLRAHGQQQALQIAGTPGYMAPEQGAGEALSEASDWYAAGVMLYQALTGVMPFRRASAAQLLKNKQTIDPPPPSEIAPGVPEDLDRLCIALLRRDPTTRPRGSEVLAALANGAPTARSSLRAPAPIAPPASSGDGAPAFVARQAELRRLEVARRAVADGRPALVWLHGPSGIGKTRLSQYFVEGLMEREHAVLLAGRCYQQESVPYKGLDSVVDELSRFLIALPDGEARRYMPRDVHALGRVFPVLGQVDGFADDSQPLPLHADVVELRRRAFSSLRELLRRIAERRLLVIALDDLQWGGDDSAALLAELLQPPDAPAMLVIGTYRSDEVEASPMLRRLTPELERIAHALHRDEIALAPLPPSAAHALAASLLCDDDREELAARIARESEGSPFFVCELARHRRAGGAAPEPSLREVILARIDLLPKTAQRLLETIAVAGRPLDRSLALRAADILDDSAAAIAELRTAHLIRVRGDEVVETYHDRIRHSLMMRLDAGRCASLHLRLAELMEADGGADPEQLTRHLLSAGEPRRAAPWAARAARRAGSALAFERAAELYRLALDIGSFDGDETRELTVRLAEALANAGRGAPAAHAYLRAARMTGGETALELRRRAAEQLLMCGRIDRGRAVLRAVLRSVGLEFPRSNGAALLSMLWHSTRLKLRGLTWRERPAADVPPALLRQIDVCWTVCHGLAGVSPLHSLAFAARGAVLALHAGEPSRIANFIGLHSTLMSAMSPGKFDRSLARAGEVADRSGDEYAQTFHQAMRGATLYFAGDLEGCVSACGRAETMLRERCRGVAWEMLTMQSVANFARTFLGDWRRTQVLVQAQIREAEQRGDLYGAATLTMALGWVRHLAADDPRAALDELDGYLKRWSSKELHYQHFYDLETRAYVHLYLGEPQRALEYVDRRWPLLRSAGIFRVQIVHTLSLALRAVCCVASSYVAGAGRARLLRRARRDLDTMRRLRFRGAAPWAMHLSGCVAAAEGDRDRAAVLLEQSGAQMTALGFHTGPVCGELLRGVLLGGDEGAGLVARATGFFASEGFRDPRRFAHLFAPGPPT